MVLTPRNAIREYCKKNCCAGDTKSWAHCSSVKCQLWAHRFGKREIPKKHRDNVKNDE